VAFPDDGQRAAIDAAIAKFQTTLAKLKNDDPCTDAARTSARMIANPTPTGV
jgi:hypothetical protein